MEDLVELELGHRRSILTLLELFAGTSLLLAVVGIYGTMGRTLAASPRSASQISPGWGFIEPLSSFVLLLLFTGGEIAAQLPPACGMEIEPCIKKRH